MSLKSKFIFELICLYLIMIATAFVKSDDIDMNMEDRLKTFPKDRIVSLDSEISEFTVKKDLDFICKIKGNPSTGYGWFLSKNNSLNGKLNCTNLNQYNSTKDYIVNEHPSGWTGVPGYYYFMFKGLEAGKYDLEFYNKRPWENFNAKVRTITIIIN